jgi:uncharacterized membrane protein YvbJ
MCELYILLAFGLGLFSGWFANFLLSGKYIEKALDQHYSQEKKEEIRQSVEKEHKRFKLSTALWVLAIFAVFMFLAYMATRPSTPSQASQEGARAIENADNNRVFNNLIDSMKKFSR